MDCLNKIMDASKSTVNKVSDMVPDIVKVDETRMINFKNDLIKVGLSTATAAFCNNTLTQRTLTHEIGSKYVGLALYYIALANKVEELEASQKILKKINFSFTVKITVVSLVSSAILSGFDKFNTENIMRDFFTLATGVAVYNMVVSKIVDRLGLTGDKHQIASDWAGVITISAVSELIKSNGNFNTMIKNFTDSKTFKNMVSNILGRNIASAIDYS